MDMCIYHMADGWNSSQNGGVQLVPASQERNVATTRHNLGGNMQAWSKSIQK